MLLYLSAWSGAPAAPNATIVAWNWLLKPINHDQHLRRVLSFPILPADALMLMRLSENAMDALARNVSYDENLTIVAIDGIVIAGVYYSPAFVAELNLQK
jgi:hypothetical protein